MHTNGLRKKNYSRSCTTSLNEGMCAGIVETVGPKGRVLLALDNDEAGRMGSADALIRLSSQVFVWEMAL